MIGKLRHRVTLQRPVITKDNIGQEIEEWQDVATVWASVEPLSGKEYFSAKQVNSEVSAKITLRFLQGITPEVRVILDKHTYNILAVINFGERNVYLQLLCSEKVGAQHD